ncbi:MAG: hypothetical protein WKG07_18385, partial [Hymenobacter sp.]
MPTGCAPHPLVARTYYLAHLEHSPAQQDIYRRHCLSPGSMISFDIKGGEAGSLPLPQRPAAHQAGREHWAAPKALAEHP